MRELTPEGRQIVEDVAARHGVSATTARSLLEALAAGGGSQAQFDIPELGGMGQWSRGGMVMVGDMFNNALKARVDALATELAGLLPGALAPVAQSQSQGGAGASLFVTGSGGSWWPQALGTPASTGAQNDMRYAYFPQSRRLAIGVGGQVTVYDTGDHRIGAFGQQQSGDRSLAFTSQHGVVAVADLPRVTGTVPPATPAGTQPAPADARQPGPPSAEPAADDIIGKIERLADLRARNILTEQEFGTKKSELLARI
jgi:hypothetical protein